MAVNLVTISSERAIEVIALNKEGEKPEALDNEVRPAPKKLVDLAEQDDLTRFDKLRNKKKKRKPQGKDRERAPRNRDEQNLNADGAQDDAREGQNPAREEQNGVRDEARKPRNDRPRNGKPRGNAPQNTNN